MNDQRGWMLCCAAALILFMPAAARAAQSADDEVQVRVRSLLPEREVATKGLELGRVLSEWATSKGPETVDKTIHELTRVLVDDPGFGVASRSRPIAVFALGQLRRADGLIHDSAQIEALLEASSSDDLESVREASAALACSSEAQRPRVREVVSRTLATTTDYDRFLAAAEAAQGVGVSVTALARLRDIRDAVPEVGHWNRRLAGQARPWHRTSGRSAEWSRSPQPDLRPRDIGRLRPVAFDLALLAVPNAELEAELASIGAWDDRRTAMAASCMTVALVVSASEDGPCRLRFFRQFFSSLTDAQQTAWVSAVNQLLERPSAQAAKNKELLSAVMSTVLSQSPGQTRDRVASLLPKIAASTLISKDERTVAVAVLRGTGYAALADQVPLE